MLTQPADKYRASPVVSLPDRQWPSRQLTHAPRWLSTDLRDGNQALAEPMDRERKMAFWDLLLGCGFREIEVAFPSASQTDFDFVRDLQRRDLHHLTTGGQIVVCQRHQRARNEVKMLLTYCTFR